MSEGKNSKNGHGLCEAGKTNSPPAHSGWRIGKKCAKSVSHLAASKLFIPIADGV
jgi:hypothetical protein